MTTIKRGPKPTHDFDNYPVGHQIKILSIKQSSFKSMVSKYNATATEKQTYSYVQSGSKILATRIS